MTREPILLDTLRITDMLPIWNRDTQIRDLSLINIRGCNGSGKSTIPMSMMDDPELYLLSWRYRGKEKPFATVFPSYECLALGTYRTKTGGLDIFKDNDMTRIALELVWQSPYNVIMEGVIASTIKSTYSELFDRFLKRIDLRKRRIIVASLIPPVSVCLERIQERNGGNTIKEDLVQSKWDIVNRNVDYFKKCGFDSIALDNSNIAKEDTCEWFWNNILGITGGNYES